MSGHVDATAYLVVRADRQTWGRPDAESGLRPIESARVVALRQGRPAKLERDEVAVKVTVRLPVEAFEPLTPAAVVTVPTDLALRGPIEVDAVQANDEESS
ncbi:hypothetical protein G8C93_00910 [Cellulosimicrobium cellulans]|uniref:hypothetical protein n=1 Tax=Cellulosimicrobium cellulans TaxID=1710 RepID=UPI0018845656|nr:hypothetical protein [Cellulosimicrobium cellulans]MBE9924452.1 hypothetical protein [Cellulosimicrobium cellulans]